MVYDLVIEGKVVDLENIFEARVGIEDGIIKEIKKQGLGGERNINAKNSLIFPGFIDLHVHMRVPGWEHKEDFSTGTKAAAHGGVTTVVDMPNTIVPATNLERILEKKKLAVKKAVVDVLFYGGVSKENISELKKMSDEVIGYKVYVCESTGDMYLPYEYVEEIESEVSSSNKPVSFHCEDKPMIEERKKKLAGRNDPEVHCDIRPAESEVIAIEKVLSLTKSRVNICHVSTKRGLEIIGEHKQKNKLLTCEVAPIHLFFTRKDIAEKKNFLKMNPPLRSEQDRKSLLEGLMKDKIDFLASDHAPHTVEEKENDVWSAPSGVPELDTYGSFVTWLMKMGVSPQTIMKMCSYNPAKFLNLNKGLIEKGKVADITIVDPKCPTKITSENLYTKCKWSPFEGIELPGKVVYTIRNGEVIMENETVVS
jgi:dihydroorotase (multifunctional complex type)